MTLIQPQVSSSLPPLCPNPKQLQKFSECPSYPSKKGVTFVPFSQGCCKDTQRGLLLSSLVLVTLLSKAGRGQQWKTGLEQKMLGCLLSLVGVHMEGSKRALH